MSWTTPRTWVAGEIETAAIFNTHVRDNLSYLGTRTESRVTRVANLSIPNNTVTNVTWDTLTSQSDSFITVPGSTHVVPAGLGGVYAITYQIVWASDPGSTAINIITAGGNGYRTPVGVTGGAAWAADSISIVVELAAAAGTVLSLYQVSGGAINVTGLAKLFCLVKF